MPLAVWGAASRRRRAALVAGLSLLLCLANTPVLSLGSVAAGASVRVNLDQWANGPRPEWRNGDLNRNNSSYGEGRVVPFRVAFEGIEPGRHSFHINYDWTFAGHKAYDFLTSYDATEAGVADDVCGDGGAGVPSQCAAVSAPEVVTFPGDPYSSSGLTVDGAVAFAGLPRKLHAYGVEPGSLAVSTTAYSGSVSKATADILVTFTTSGSAVLFLWGGHLAQSTYWDATPNGAGQISGAGWHMRTQQLDGQGNRNQDRSVQPPRALAPGLTLGKTADATSVQAGAQVGYTIALGNPGPGEARDVVVSDALPVALGLDWSVEDGVSGCAIAGGVLTCGFGDISPNAAKVIHLISPTTQQSCGVLSNSARATWSGASAATAQAETISIVGCARPDVEIAETANGPLSEGAMASFFIAVTAAGTGTSTGVVASAKLPAGTWKLGGAHAAQCAVSTGALNCAFGDMAHGATKTIALSRATNAGDCPTIGSVATVNAASDSDTTNNSAAASIAVSCAAGTSTPTPTPIVTPTDIPAPAATPTPAPPQSTPVPTTTPPPISAATPTPAPTSTPSLTSSPAATPAPPTPAPASTPPLTSTPPPTSTPSLTSSPAATPAPPPSSAPSSTATPSPRTTPPLTPLGPGSPEVSVVKTADAPYVAAFAQTAGRVGFAIVVTNIGGVATTVVLKDVPLIGSAPGTPPANAGTLGLGWSVDREASDAGCAIQQNALSCDWGSLEPDEARRVHITAQITARVAADTRNDNCGQRVDNVARVTLGDGSARRSDHAIVDIACLPTSAAGSLRITKYADNNANGRQDDGEPLLGGWRFEVRNNSTGETRTATTGASGSAVVADLEFGQYTVREVGCAAPCVFARWQPVSYLIGTAASSIRSGAGAAQIGIESAEQSISFGNRQSRLPSTSTDGSELDEPGPNISALFGALAALFLIWSRRRDRRKATYSEPIQTTGESDVR